MSAESQPWVGIVTVNYNGAAFVGDFVRSVNQLTYPHRHLIVVDNASRDDSVEEFRGWCPEAIILQNTENLGITGGNNRGIAYCLEHGFPYTLFINNDTIVEPDLLEQLLAHADDRTLVAPRVYLYSHPHLLDDTAGEFDWRRGVWRHWIYGKPPSPADDSVHEVDMASLCCLLVPTNLFRRIGGMDDNFFMYYDDFDFVARAQRQGCRLVLNPRAVVYHRKGGSSGGAASPFLVYYATRNRLYLMKKHSSRPAFVLFLAYFLATRAFRAAGYALRGQGPTLKAMACGLLDYYRGRMGRTWETKASPQTTQESH